MSSTVNTFIASGNTPPWLPRDVAEGRRYAWWGQIMFLLTALMWFIIAIVELTLYATGGGGRTSLTFGVFGLFALIICLLSSFFLRKTVLDAIDQGRFHDARNDTIVWIVLGLFGFALPSIFLVLTYVKIGDALAQQAPPGYQPYAPGTATAQAPGQPYAPPPVPPPQPAPPAAAPAHPHHAHQQHQAMLRCKNCNVQYPTFMHNCPNCGAPKEGA